MISSRALIIMTENECISEKERTDYQSGQDLLSCLPLSIIHIILAFVPIRDAIRTSLLSRNWRYTWTSLPYLAFDRECANHDESVSNREECLSNFITRALSLHKGSIHKFEMSLSLRKSWLNMDEWLVFLSRNDIRELILNLGYGYSWRDLQQVHSSVYSCNKLTYLELHTCKVGPPPSTFKGLLFLRSLILVHVYVSHNDVESLVANSPLLERLKLKNCRMENPITELRISAPNLKYIYLEGESSDYIEIHLCAPLLAEMYVTNVSVREVYDIRELILNLGDYKGYSRRDLQQVHSSVYFCNKLTYLELHTCKVGPPPSTFKGFLFLRSLILVHVYLSPNDVENLVANSPLLERLNLEYYVMENPITELKISAPNLKYIYLEGGDYIGIYLCAPLLAEMYVSVWDNLDFIAECEKKKRSICNYTNLIGGCTNLEKLRGDFYFTKIMSIGIESCQHSFVFHSLKVIKLNDVNFQDAKEISVVARLVIGAPNLHKLKFSSNYSLREGDSSSSSEEDTDDTSDSKAPLVSYMDFHCAPDFKWEKLRLITMSSFTGHHSEMEFLKLLLERSPVLERMKLCPVDQLSFKEVRSLRAELFRCNPASPNFKLWFY